MRFLHVEGARAVPGRRLELRQRRHVHAAPAALELPAVVGTFEPATFHAAERQARAAVRAAVDEGMGTAGIAPPEDERLPEQVRRERRGPQVAGRGDGVPMVVFDHRGKVAVVRGTGRKGRPARKA